MKLKILWQLTQAQGGSMTRTLLPISILAISMLLFAACSSSSTPQVTVTTGRYVVREKTPFTNQVYIELKTWYPGGGDYYMNPPSNGKYEIKDGKIFLYDEPPFHKEQIELKYTGIIKDGDIYLPLSWGVKALGDLRFIKENSNEPEWVAGRVAASQATASQTKPSAPPQPSLDDQAVDEIRKMYGSIYAKCGDSYYRIETGMPPTYRQFKEVTFQAAPRALSEADRLNGVEWTGKVNVSTRFVRSTFAQGGKQHWRDYGVPAEVAHFNARKVKGSWQLDDMFPSLRQMYRKPTCAEIPKD